MTLNMDAIGKKIGPLKKDYDWKDVILYAIGVGAGSNELGYTYEKDLKVIPSFSIAAVFDFLGHVGAASNMNLAGILHGEQDLIFHNPIPTSGTLTTEGKITHYYDKGKKGSLVVAEGETFHSNGKKLFTNVITIFARLDGGFGGEDTPPKVFEYRLGNRSALEWVVDQYEVSEDKRSGIRSDPNRPDDPQYIVRLIAQVITVSLETMRVVKGLPALEK